MNVIERTVGHIGFVTANMQRTLRRFVQEGAQIMIDVTSDPIQRVEVCLLRIDGAADIELVGPLPEGNSPIASRLARGGGLDHICYLVQDVARALTEEEEKGALIVCTPCYAVAFRRTIGFAQRRTGLVVEYMSLEEVNAPN